MRIFLNPEQWPEASDIIISHDAELQLIRKWCHLTVNSARDTDVIGAPSLFATAQVRAASTSFLRFVPAGDTCWDGSEKRSVAA